MGHYPTMSRAVHFRVPEDQYRRYEAEAVAAGTPLSELLRRRLESADRIADEIAQLRLAVLDGESLQHTPPVFDSGPAAVNLEALLLLRSLVAPSQLRGVHAEIERSGLRPWTPASHSS